MSLILQRSLATACCVAIALTARGRGQDTVPPPKAPDGSAWSQLISGADLQAEVVAVRRRMSTKLVSLGAYNRSYRELRVDATSLALLAHVASQHDGKIPWKKQAPSVVTLAGQISAITDSASARGRKSHQSSVGLFETLCGILDGKGDAKDIDQDAEYPEFAPYEAVMKRNDSVLSWLRPAFKKPEELAANTDRAARELRIVALNASVLTAEAYGYADDDEFASYAKMLRDGAVAAADAATDGNLEQLKQRVETLTKACIKCHREYRNG